MAHVVKLTDIKEITWELVLHYLENYQRGYKNKIFNKDFISITKAQLKVSNKQINQINKSKHTIILYFLI